MSKSAYLRIAVFILTLLTIAVNCVLYKTTAKYGFSDDSASYSLEFEVKSGHSGVSPFNFVFSCFNSDSGAFCKPKSTQYTVFPGILYRINLSSPAPSGKYRGIRVQINGSRDSFYVKSITLQNKKIFDGQDYSTFSNVKGMTITADRNMGMALFRFTADSASFDIDSSFSVASDHASAIKYTDAVLFTVLFLSVLILLASFGKSGLVAVPKVEKEGCMRNETELDCGIRRFCLLTNILKYKYNLKNRGEDARKFCSGGVRLAALRLSLYALIFDLLFIVLASLGQQFLSNDFSISFDNAELDSFLLEVSDSSDFSYTSGSASFFINHDSRIKVPERFASVRISQPSGSRLKVFSSSGSCELKNSRLETEGDLSCRTDDKGRLYLNFDSEHNLILNIIFGMLAASAVSAAMYFAFKFLESAMAVRLMLVLIMISAYITGEICMNVESGNIIFYRSYLQLLPDVVLRNICPILIIFLLAVLSFSRGFICSGIFLQVLLLTIAYIAIDWGVFQNFGVRSDFRTMLSHAGAGDSTALVFVETFFRKSHASWMVLVMMADWVLMALSFRLRKSHSLKKYLLLILIINAIPFLKVYENFYEESSFRLQQDIFDIQGELAKPEIHYTRNFPEYDWKPDYQVIDGLNRRKNVVILLVESLINSYSHHFSGLEGHMPEIDRLAEQNASFLNYHSTGLETMPATYSILTGKLYFPDLDTDSRNMHFEYDDALPNVMKADGYDTYAIFSSGDVMGLDEVYSRSGFDTFYGSDDPAYNGAKRYLFNAVSDGVLLNHAADLIDGFDQTGKPHLTLIMTASSHNPFLNPETGKKGYAEVISYVDREIGNFVRKLEKNGFFDNGTLLITGDHYAPGLNFVPGELNKYGEDLNRVPLIIVDRDIGKKTFSNVFGHDSLKAIIEYLNLKKVKKYEYQLVPFWKPEENRSVTVLCPIINISINLNSGIRVSGPNGEQGIYDAKGDSSKFTSHFLDSESEKEVAGRVKWLQLER